MKRIEDIKEFEDIDTYYEISNIVAEVFQDRVEAHKHLVTANKEIERLNNIINELEKDLYKIRELTFNKYNSNEWNNCLSFNDDILPVINRLKELKGSESNE